MDQKTMYNFPLFPFTVVKLFPVPPVLACQKKIMNEWAAEHHHEIKNNIERCSLIINILNI